MPENSNISFSDSMVFIKSADGNEYKLADKVVSDSIQLERISGEDLEWDFSKSGADLCFTADFAIDKRNRRKLNRKLKKMMKGKPLKIQYRLLSPCQRVKLWCIIHFMKLYHKPLAIRMEDNRLLVCNDINEML